MVRRSPTGTLKTSGKRDILTIVLISLVLVAALLFVLFKIIGHSEEHVETVRKTKVLYKESLRWRPDDELCESRIQRDLIKFPNRTKATYADLSLNENCLRLIGRMSRLEDLKLTRSIVHDPWLAHITHLKLKALRLHGTPTTNKAVPYILKLQYLTHLEIGDTELTDRGLEQLSASETLKSLQINLGRCITNDGIKHVGKMTSLTNLEISNTTSITGKCLAYLTNLKNLNFLIIENMRITAEDLHHLSSLKNLRALNASSSQLTDPCLIEIAKLDSLTHLNLAGSDFTDRGLVALEKLDKLTELKIKDCPNVSDKAVAKLKAKMPHCRIVHTKASVFSEKMKRPDVKMELEFLETEAKNELEKSKAKTK